MDGYVVLCVRRHPSHRRRYVFCNGRPARRPVSAATYRKVSSELHSEDSFNFNIFTQSVQGHVQHPENVFASLFAHNSSAGNSNSDYRINIEVFW